MNKEFWKNKKVLITGNTGFKGSWLSEILLRAGADVIGYALQNEIRECIFNTISLEKEMECVYGDICDEDLLARTVKRVRPDVVFHLAAQPLVRTSYKEPVYTYKTNVIGTVNLLNSLRSCESVRAIVNVTTDKVYYNNGGPTLFNENDRLGGYDPYSASKACSEIVTESFVLSFFNPEKYGKDHNVAIATARAGNVIGGGDYSEDRIIPDCIRAVRSGKQVVLRSPNANRPWQHVLEPLSFYIMLAEKLYSSGVKYNGAYNIGPEIKDCLTVVQIVNMIKKYIPDFEIVIANDKAEGPHESANLTLDTGKIREQFGFTNKWDIEKCIKNTAEWYRDQMFGANMKKVTDKMIEDYFA